MKKKPVLSYELFLEYGGEGGIDSLCSPLRGSPLTAFAVCPTGCASCRTPVGGSHPPAGVQYAKKKPVLSYELFLKYGGEGGIDSLRSPLRAAHSLRSRSVQLAAPVVEPRSGLLIPPQACNRRKKSPYFRTSSFSNMAVRGGLTRFARPFGAAHSLRSRSVQLAAPVVEPRSGVRSPLRTCNRRKKSPYFRTSSFSNMAVRGGFEPPIRCRIHTFQACSFSHSDTSPYCLPSIAGTSANVGKRLVSVNKLF